MVVYGLVHCPPAESKYKFHMTYLLHGAESFLRSQLVCSLFSSLFACCTMFPLEKLPLSGDPSVGVVYLQIVLSPEQASRM